jgi:hypothetical protein
VASTKQAGGQAGGAVGRLPRAFESGRHDTVRGYAVTNGCDDNLRGNGDRDTHQQMRDHVSLLVAEFVQKLIAAVEDEALVRARQSVVRGLDALSPVRRGATPSRGASVRPAGPVSAARRRQGQYLGRLKRLTGSARKRVQALAREKGVAEAIKLADRLAPA